VIATTHDPNDEVTSVPRAGRNMEANSNIAVTVALSASPPGVNELCVCVPGNAACGEIEKSARVSLLLETTPSV
jgi:hypothetical protein